MHRMPQAETIQYTTAPVHEAKMCKASIIRYSNLLVETRAIACKIKPKTAKAREFRRLGRGVFGPRKINVGGGG